MSKKAFLYIILAGIFWGTSGIYVHYLAPLGLSSMQITTIRGIISAVAMSVYLFYYDKKLFRVSGKEILLFVLSAVAMYFTSVFYFYSMQLTSVSTAVVLMYTAPIIVLIYSVTFLGERLNTVKVISIIAMVIGCALVSGIVGGFKFSALGLLFGFGSGFAYSSYNIITKIQMQKKINPITASTYTFIFMCIISIFCSDTGAVLRVAAIRPDSILLMIGCGVCTCIAPYFLYTLALRTLPAGTASALAIVEPMAATIMSVLFLGEVLTPWSIAGIVLILGSVYMLGKSNR